MTATPAGAALGESEAEPLFRPLELPGLRLRNRVVMSPMSRYFCPRNVPTEEVAAYYGRRAANGVGLIISEGSYIGHPTAGSYPKVPHFHGAEALQGWRRVLAEVHAQGARMFPQLWHVGSFRQLGQSPDPAVPGIAPSAVLNRYAGNEHAPQPMTSRDMEEIVAAFAAAAKSAQELGFDGVELHGAHGYLIDQFFWPVTNRRRDAYGGSIPKRVRFAVEVVRAVRAAVGRQLPLSFRFSQWKQQDFQARLASSPQQLEAFLLPLREAGVSVFHASTRRWWEAEFPNSPLSLAGWVKKITGCPTIAVGSVGLDSTSFRRAGKASIEPLLERLGEGEFDLVAVGRALLADPAWANKVRNRDYAAIETFSAEAIERLF